MMWFVTAALDGRVKLWSEQNLLVRELDLYVALMTHPLRIFVNSRSTAGVNQLP